MSKGEKTGPQAKRAHSASLALFALSIPGIYTNSIEIRASQPESAKTPTKPHTGDWANYAESAESRPSPCPSSGSFSDYSCNSSTHCPICPVRMPHLPLPDDGAFPDARMKTGGYRGGRGWWRLGIWGAVLLYAMTKKPMGLIAGLLAGGGMQ